MREIDCKTIIKTVAVLCVQANKLLPQDVVGAVHAARQAEQLPLAQSIMQDLCDNIDAAQRLDIPVCQDTGMAVVFVELGQEVHIIGGALSQAINDGVRDGYVNGKLRLSVVEDPLNRVNTGDNTPAIVHYSIVPGDRLKITVAPKGFGSENMSGLRMLTPAADRKKVIDTVVEIVKAAGSNPCPPMVVGVGIGGDFEYAAILAKKALCRPVDSDHPNPYYRQLETDLLQAVNALDIGPQGFGGKTTALKVNVEYFGTHIAGLPVAVNIGCHVTRHQTAVL